MSLSEPFDPYVRLSSCTYRANYEESVKVTSNGETHSFLPLHALYGISCDYLTGNAILNSWICCAFQSGCRSPSFDLFHRNQESDMRVCGVQV